MRFARIFVAIIIWSSIAKKIHDVFTVVWGS